MASLMEVLIDVLEQENQEYEKLLSLSMRKTSVIVSEDLTELAKITDEEQIIVGRINHLDHQRNEAVNDIADVLNKDVDKLKIDNFSYTICTDVVTIIPKDTFNYKST